MESAVCKQNSLTNPIRGRIRPFSIPPNLQEFKATPQTHQAASSSMQRLFTTLIVLAPLAFPLPSWGGKPNVLILFTDDQRADTIRSLGNPDIHTPHLDTLVETGHHVSSAYCLGSNMPAVCRPSRNMFLSGRTYFRWTHPPEGTPQRNAPALGNTLPATFNAAGYETYHHGKRGNVAENIHKQFDHSRYLNDFDVRWSMEAGKEIVDQAIEFLNRRPSKSSPWLMYLAFATPHDPRAASREALSRYHAQPLQLPSASAPSHPYDNGSVLGRDEWTALWPRTPQVIRDQLHDYYATITTIDAHIGRLLETLKARGDDENTIIVFSSDHGLSMGSHGLMGKQNVYEPGYKAPMILTGPGIKKGSTDDPVYLLDLFPTLCELTGIPVPQGLDGCSFAGMVRGETRGTRDAVLLSYADTQRAIRHQDWKLIRYPQINRNQLFHLANDPHETHDLASHGNQQRRIDRLLAKMKTLQREQGDSLSLRRANPLPARFQAPTTTMAAKVAPPLPASKPRARELHATTLAGWSGSSEGEPFTVLRPEGGYFTALAVGLSRTQPTVVTGLRIDITPQGAGDPDRETVIVGDPNSRWTPLLDQMKPHRQPIGIHGASGHVIDRIGFIQSDGRVSPAFGGRGGDTTFDLRIGVEDSSSLASAFRGFHGSTAEFNGSVAIESLGLLFAPEQ